MGPRILARKDRVAVGRPSFFAGRAELVMQPMTASGATWDKLVAKLPIAVTGVSDLVYLADGTIAVLAFGMDGNQHIITGRMGPTTTPLVEETLRSNRHVFWVRDDSILIVEKDPSTNTGILSWRSLSHLGSDAPTVRPVVRPELQAFGVAEGGYNGRDIVAAVVTGEGVDIATLAIDSGASKTLATGFETAPWSFVSYRDNVVYAAKKKGGDVALQLVSRSSGGPAKTLLTDADDIQFRLSRDGSTVVFHAGPLRGADELGSLPTDGSTAPTYAVRKAANQTIEFANKWNEFQTTNGRFLVSLTTAGSDQDAKLRLVDETATALANDWRKGTDFAIAGTTLLSDDGSVIYSQRLCNSTAAAGVQWMQLWPSETAITGCETGDASLLGAETIPNSSAIMIPGGTFNGGPNLVRIFRP